MVLRRFNREVVKRQGLNNIAYGMYKLLKNDFNVFAGDLKEFGGLHFELLKLSNFLLQSSNQTHLGLKSYIEDNV